MLRYFEFKRDCDLISNIIEKYAEEKLSKTEGKYMGEREHLLQAEVYLRKCIQELEYAESYSIQSLKK
jgi:hypothetical protein